MTLPQALALFVAAMLAGALNSVAGGGSFISFPALLQIGRVPAIAANATNTVALWPGSVASIAAYRRELRSHGRRLASLAPVSLAGGVLGALLLIKTPERTFLMVLPWLLLTATLLFAFGKRITAWTADRRRTGSPRRPWAAALGAALLQLVIATYGGYFGGGIGMLMLALLSVMGMTEIHAMNAMKATLASCINGVAVVTFIWYGQVAWPHALLMIVGAVAGGYGGAHYAMKLPPALVRGFVLCVGFGMTIYFFVRPS
jgi:hypothetical protein